jgi:RimJ/RimL family protein N-acetyltransferase
MTTTVAPVDELSSWTPRIAPARAPIAGTHAMLEPLEPERHGDDLFAAATDSSDPGMWSYLPYGPFRHEAEFAAFLARQAATDDPMHFAIIDRESGRAVGMCSFMRMDLANGAIEIGHIWFGPRIQRSTTASEAIYLMQRETLGKLGYRRLEWKCDNANARSKRAAARFGFTFEGIFRQHSVVKGKNRDTAWFSLLDSEWPANERAFDAWLAPENFDADGNQRRSLSEIRAAS